MTDSERPQITDADCVTFLQWCLPRMQLRWPGFRKVRRQVRKRISGRLQELQLTGLNQYRDYLVTHDDEWNRLRALCRITISRFFRDRGTFQYLRRIVWPALIQSAAPRSEMKFWSAGCASGEEPYSVAMVCLNDGPPLDEMGLSILATDADANLLRRAKTARYPASSLRDVPDELRTKYFEPRGDEFQLMPCVQNWVQFKQQDLLQQLPDLSFDMILCRYLAFTYFDDALQRRMAHEFAKRLHSGGWLVLGKHESLPDVGGRFAVIEPHLNIYRRC